MEVLDDHNDVPYMALVQLNILDNLLGCFCGLSRFILAKSYYCTSSLGGFVLRIATRFTMSNTSNKCEIIAKFLQVD